MDFGEVIGEVELEDIIKNLRAFTLTQYGSKTTERSINWWTQHERIQRLNVRAHQDVVAKREELVTRYFVHCLQATASSASSSASSPLRRWSGPTC
ncbi:MYND finger [Carpediemonas membranifera]|uniref:MYND finger n=1 Tax=Carpediemonas membranifera TaxID=201153 RepID=A0A8J6BWV0_9EUKA|nr:MYND finger [Carpediemonas membranifera]|eukprot:KAG9392796.1 MYND finger [Carpediemonas membranifera]